MTESAIIEDPSVIYEGGVYLPEPVTLENYLVSTQHSQKKKLTSLLQFKITKETHVRLLILLSFILQVPFDFIDFSKDFLEGKIDLEESSEDDEV